MMVSQIMTPGLVKETIGQRKKHVSMMSDEEIEYLVKRVKRQCHSWSESEHLTSSGRHFHKKYIQDILSSDISKCLIEYNERFSKTFSRRVLLRSSYATPALLDFDGHRSWFFANLCIVIDIDTGRIVTAYWNKVSDSHGSINFSRYDETLQILKHKKSR